VKRVEVVKEGTGGNTSHRWQQRFFKLFSKPSDLTLLCPSCFKLALLGYG